MTTELFAFSGCLHHHPFLIVKLLELTQDLPIGWFHVSAPYSDFQGPVEKDGFLPPAPNLTTGALKFGSQDGLSGAFLLQDSLPQRHSAGTWITLVLLYVSRYPPEVQPHFPPISVFPIKIWNSNTRTYTHTFHILHISPDGTHRTR